jgi:CheY-like chemotaxis protein
MSALLGGWGCAVYGAVSADEALALLPSLARPDVVIADYHLDDEALGTAALERIAACYGKKLPTILITADRSPDVEAAARRHGYRLLKKPLKPAQLRSLLLEMLR